MAGHWRPKTREDCELGARPCPWAACKHHLALEVRGTSLKRVGNLGGESLTLAPRDGKRFDDWSDALISVLSAMPETCALDVAREGASQKEVSEILNLSVERVSQIEKSGLRKLRLGCE
jgi:hypothetical protein